MIQVTCGIIVKESKILAVQRGPNSSHPMKWEFPGGKIDRDEIAEHCIVRELSEELQVRVRILSRLESINYKYPDKHIELIPFVCEIVSGELILTEHVRKCWFAFNDWKTIDWCEADLALIEKNQDQLKKAVV